MTTSVWTDIVQESSDTTLQSEPRRSAPPIMQQSVTQPEEEVVWDDSLMELDYDEPQTVAKVEAPESSTQEIQPIDIGILYLVDLTDMRPLSSSSRGCAYKRS
jgi:hypothetical protein